MLSLAKRSVHPGGGLPRETANSMLWKRFGCLVPEVAKPALRLLDSSLTYQALSRDPAFAETEVTSQTVVLAGGQSLVRATRRSVLERAGLVVAAEVEDASRAAKAAELYGARLVLVDSEIGGGCVLAVRRIVERAPGTAVVVVAPELDEAALLAAVQAGADGFVLETHAPRGRRGDAAASGDDTEGNRLRARALGRHRPPAPLLSRPEDATGTPPDSRARIDVLTRTGRRRSDCLRGGAPVHHIETDQGSAAYRRRSWSRATQVPFRS